MNSEPNPKEIEPTTGSARAPVWLFVLTALLAFWGMSFLDNHGGGFDARVYAPYKSIAEVEDDWPRANGPDPRSGRVAFGQLCAVCHMETGLGNPANNVPPLFHSEWVLAESPDRLIRIVLNGLQGPVTVDGKQFNSNGMLPWRDQEGVTDAKISDILTFLRQNKEWGHNAPPVTPEQVAKIREETKGRAIQWTIDELMKVPEK
ncbi:MAG: cytochrome c [Verrucomicrobia bacterium]|nr:MAG: cytochrome c [Verrucomicrobiota bacterium]